MNILNKRTYNITNVDLYFDYNKHGINVERNKLIVGGSRTTYKKNPLNDLDALSDGKDVECFLTGGKCFNNKEREKILNDLKIKLYDINDIMTKTKCRTRKCVAKYFNISNESFNPSGPYNTVNLLNNVNIINVLKKYENIYHDFKALDFVMDNWQESDKNNDIYKLVTDPSIACKLFRDGKKCIGFIMNTDTWDGGGLHWTSMFIDLRNDDVWTVEFFNSSSKPPSSNTRELIKSIVLNLSGCISKPDGCRVESLNMVKDEHQLSETECGVYCLFMIYNRCNKQDVKYFEFAEYDKISDESMVKFRSFIFS
jgi:hypothetical protein